jgi:hypothetical protein
MALGLQITTRANYALGRGGDYNGPSFPVSSYDGASSWGHFFAGRHRARGQSGGALLCRRFAFVTIRTDSSEGSS